MAARCHLHRTKCILLFFSPALYRSFVRDEEWPAINAWRSEISPQRRSSARIIEELQSLILGATACAGRMSPPLAESGGKHCSCRGIRGRFRKHKYSGWVQSIIQLPGSLIVTNLPFTGSPNCMLKEATRPLTGPPVPKLLEEYLCPVLPFKDPIAARRSLLPFTQLSTRLQVESHSL